MVETATVTLETFCSLSLSLYLEFYDLGLARISHGSYGLSSAIVFSPSRVNNNILTVAI